MRASGGRPAPQGKARRQQKIPGEEHLVRRAGSDHWHIDITIGGHRLRRTCGTAEKARAAQLAVEEHDALWRRVMLGEVPQERLTVGKAFLRFYDEVAAGTRYGEQAQKHQMATMLELLPVALDLEHLDDAVVNRLVQDLRKRQVIPHNAPEDAPSRVNPRLMSGATINRYVTTLSAVCTRARKVWKVPVGEWERGQHRQEESRGREVFLEQDQARQILDAVVAHAKPILFLALSTGLRKANVHNLAWEEVSLDMARLVLVTKGGKPHAVPLPPEAVALLVHLEPDPAERRGRVFRFGNPRVGCTCAACVSPAKKGHPINSTRRAFGTAAREAGLADMPMGRLRFHDLRHSMASWVLAAGGDLRLLQEQLGHADITTTARYAHLVAGRREAVVRAATAGLLAPPSMEKKKA